METLQTDVHKLCYYYKTQGGSKRKLIVIDSPLRDRIINDVKSSSTRKRLLEKRQLKLKNTIDICKSMESSKSKIKSMGDATPDVHKITKGRRSSAPHTSGKGHPGSKTTQYGRSPPVMTCKFCSNRHIWKKESCPAWGQLCKNYKKQKWSMHQAQASKTQHLLQRLLLEDVQHCVILQEEVLHASQYQLPIALFMTNRVRIRFFRPF